MGMQPMREVGPKILGKILAFYPVLKWIESYAFKRVKGHLYDGGNSKTGGPGNLYMGRWRLIDEAPWGRVSKAPGDWLEAGGDQISRTRTSLWLQRLTGYWAARLHHINRADHDRDLHNHPFDYRTFVVRGWYDEVYLDASGAQRTRRIGRGQTAYSKGAFHRIAAVSPGGVWTVFVMGKNRGEWGFRVKTGHGRFKYVSSSVYFWKKGIDDSGMAA